MTTVEKKMSPGYVAYRTPASNPNDGPNRRAAAAANDASPSSEHARGHRLSAASVFPSSRSGTATGRYVPTFRPLTWSRAW
jgi:hypothetical protein